MPASEKGNTVEKGMEGVQAAHYEVGDAQLGKASYRRWHRKPPVVECGCGRMLSTSGSTTTCSDCGADHTHPLLNG
jgi:hypothetical protein